MVARTAPSGSVGPEEKGDWLLRERPYLPEERGGAGAKLRVMSHSATRRGQKNRPGSPGKPYLGELDLLRGVAIMAVVAAHAALPLMGDGARAGWGYAAAVAVNQLARFSVPAFLFISGLLITYRESPPGLGPAAVPSGWGAMLGRRVRGILPPYIVWSVLGWLAAGGPAASGGWRAALEEPARILFLGQGTYYQLYFVPLIFQMYLLAPLLAARLGPPGGQPRWGVVVGAIAVQLGVVGGYELFLDGVIRLPEGWASELRTVIRITFPAWIGYFVAGMATGRIYPHAAGWVDGLPGRAVLAAWTLSAGLLIWDYFSAVAGERAPSAGSADFMRLAVILYAGLSVILLLKGTRVLDQLLGPQGPARDSVFRRLGTVLARLGQYSFGIYLVHVALLKGAGSWGRELQGTGPGMVVMTLLILILSLGLAGLGSRLPWGWLVVGRPTRRPQTA